MIMNDASNSAIKLGEMIFVKVKETTRKEEQFKEKFYSAFREEISTIRGNFLFIYKNLLKQDVCDSYSLMRIITYYYEKFNKDNF